MILKLFYNEGTIEKLQRILRSHKITSTFYTESTFRKLLCKTKDRLVTENKNNIGYNTVLLSALTAKQSTFVNLYGL